MKKLILLFALSFSLTSCVGQKIEQKPLYRVIAFVDKTDGVVRLDPTHDSSVSYSVPDGEYVHDKEYVFWLDITDCKDCRTKKAVVETFGITSAQAQRDMEAAASKVSHREIIK